LGRRSCKQLSAFVTVGKNFLPKSHLRTERGSTLACAHAESNGISYAFLIPVRMLIAESKVCQNNMSNNKSQGQVIGDVNFGKVYQVKLTYQLRYSQILM